MLDRIKRVVAFFIDWNLSLLPALLIAVVASLIDTRSPLFVLFALLCLFVMLSCVALFLFCDVIFGGRSLGFRILGLYLVDHKTAMPVSWGRRLVPRLFFLQLNFIELIFVLVSGRTVGDYAACTVALSKRSMENYTPKPVKRIVVSVIVSVLLIVGLFVGGLIGGLEAAKQSEAYEIAYEHLVESDAFERLDLDPDKVHLTSYNYSSTVSASDGKRLETATYGFFVGRYSFTVVCHKTESGWVICEDCPGFH